MTNIFMLPGSLGEEDRFTASLHYLIESSPQIGQQFVDAIHLSAGRRSSQLVGFEDHPNCDVENRPDLLLECEDFDLICEHKLLSPLGDRQLERYLGIKRKKPVYVALISLGNCIVSKDVSNNPNYIRPIDATHFNWRELYPALCTGENRLGRDFVAYMNSLGMKPLELPNGWGDLFTCRTTAEAFGMQFQSIREYFSGIGAQCTIDGSRLGFQIRTPTPLLRLFYLSVASAASTRSRSFGDDVLSARVYVGAANATDKFEKEGTISYRESSKIQATPRNQLASWDKDIRQVYEYQTPLDSVLSKDVIFLKANLLQFAKSTFEHACAMQGEVDSLAMEPTAN